jgi:AcrR family transcriptional regulator
MATRRRGRRTQEERTATMRTRLLQATVECLVDHGYVGTTTTAVVARAGVSRGAILHHFPTKADLVATAVEYVLDRRNEEFRKNFARLPRDEGLMDAVLDALWKEVNGPTFHAWLELIVASRTDPQLRKKVNVLAQKWAESIDSTFREIFGLPRTPDKHPFALAPLVTFTILEGLAIEKIARTDDPALEKRVIKALKTIAPLATMRSIPTLQGSAYEE